MAIKYTAKDPIRARNLQNFGHAADFLSATCEILFVISQHVEEIFFSPLRGQQLVQVQNINLHQNCSWEPGPSSFPKSMAAALRNV